MAVTIEQQHQWLQQLVGKWTLEMECDMGPGQPASKSTATEVVRTIGGIWTISEQTIEIPEEGSATNVMTLGYDPAQSKFIGTFISSMMTHQWTYQGTLDDSGTVLTLETVGPDFHHGGMANYLDIITIVSPDHRMLTSRCQQPDGEWKEFVVCHYWRQSE